MRFWNQTETEKRHHAAGLALFFGALLGANLGTLNALPLYDYIFLVVLLVGAVTTIQISVGTERRAYAALLVALYALILGAIYFVPSLRPEIAEEDLLKLLATLGIWFGATVLVELTPTYDGARVPAAAPSATAGDANGASAEGG